MKKRDYFSAIVVFLIAIAMFFPVNIFAQIEQGEIAEGTEYWFGIPHCRKSSDEPVRWGIYPIELWVSSKVKTRFTIESADGTLQKMQYEVTPGNVKVISLSEALMNRESEVITKKGIYIKSQEPISLGVFMAYKWSGEAYRVIPVEWLGKKYYTLNLYQDQTKMHSGVTEWKPAQILIVATRDNTTVKYRPTYETMGGVKAGQTAQIVLNKGETFLIEGKIDANLNQDWRSDLTGTYIEASEPIAVISGHTKGAFPRFSASMYGIKADFIRNMLADMMWPVELLGTEYISAPIKYRDRNVWGLVPDDKGDIIRFVATEKNTIIYQMRSDGNGLKQISPVLQPGQDFKIISMQEPAYYKSNKPVLVGQYGKSWVLNLPPPAVPGQEDDLLNPSRNGQGMMLVLAPIERWCSYASFRTAPGMDAFFYLTFRTEDVQKIKVDGELLTVKYGSAVQQIKGTPYSYVVNEISPGDHIIEGIDGAKFAGYAYGNWDAYKDGFAYGYPIGINYATPCDDSIYVVHNQLCGDIDAQVVAVDLQPDTSCAGIFNVIFRASDSYNYEFWMPDNFRSGQKRTNFTLKVKDITDTAYAVVDVMTRSGKKLRKYYSYTPEKVEVTPTFVDFGLLKINESVCKKFKIKNPTSVNVLVNELKLKNEKEEFVIDSKDLPLVLAPGESKEIEVCATALTLDTKPVEDSIIAVLSCYERTIVGLRLSTGEPIVWISDANWGQQPINTEKPRNVVIENRGIVDVVLDGMDWLDKAHYRVENINFPLTISPGASYTFTVYYKPLVAGEQNSTRARFTGNPDPNNPRNKLWSDWVGEGIDVGPGIEGYDWMKRRVIDGYAGVTEYEATISISNTGNTTLRVDDIVIENDPDGVFRIDRTQIPPELKDGETKFIRAYFAPKAEKEYIATITLISNFNNQEIRVSSELRGVGAQPHIWVTGKDFGKAIIEGSSVDGYAFIEHRERDAQFSWPLQIFNIRIEGQHKDYFRIDPAWYSSQTFPITIPIGGNLSIPITYTAKAPCGGEYHAQIIADCDAPTGTGIDRHSDELIGRCYRIETNSAGYDYGVLYKSISRRGTVWFQNLSTVPITITRDITASISGADVNNFQIDNWYTDVTNLRKPTAPFDLQPGERLMVEVIFTPDAVKTFTATIEYLSSNSGVELEKRYSQLVGRGMIQEVVVEVPKGYKASPGATIDIDVKLYNDANEVKALETANILSYKSTVTFKSEGRLNVQDVFPDVKGCVDIITSGTMSEGWKCNYAYITDGQVLQVSMSAPDATKPLRNNGSNVLYKFKMHTFLSDLDVVPLPVNFMPVDVNEVADNRPSEYVVVRRIPGEIEITPVCVNTLRLIKLSGSTFSIQQNEPNPTSSFTTIHYSVGFETRTTIKLYNYFGQEVMTLVDEVLKPGQYELYLDVNKLGLPSGIYYYRMDSGVFSETKSMSVTK